MLFNFVIIGINCVYRDLKVNAKMNIITLYNKWLANMHSNFISEKYDRYLQAEYLMFFYSEWQYHISYCRYNL